MDQAPALAQYTRRTEGSQPVLSDRCEAITRRSQKAAPQMGDHVGSIASLVPVQIKVVVFGRERPEGSFDCGGLSGCCELRAGRRDGQQQAHDSVR